VTAFYVSNVESYLHRDGSWPTFCANVATLPLDDASVFIRPSGFGAGTYTLQTRPINLGSLIVDGRSGAPATPTTYLSMRPTATGLTSIQEDVKSCG